MVLAKKLPFWQLFFLGNIAQENVFYDILEGKNAFLGYKNKKFKKWKNWHFSNGLTHAFGPKMAILAPFLFRQYTPGKCLLQYSRTRKRLSTLWKKEIQKVEKLTFFPKRITHRFGPKMSIFPTFFFRQYRVGKCLLWYSRTKRRLFRL